jgi:competence protein ComEA
MSDRQLDGAIVLIVIAVIIYTLTFSSFLLPSNVCDDIPYRDMRHDQIVIGITGDTSFQGIYWLPRKTKLIDLLKAAGIQRFEKFDEKTLHAQLSHGNDVVIDSGCKIIIREMDNAIKLALNIPININKATLDDLMLIPGIGEKTALQIVQFREKSGKFRILEDLMKIRGIKEKKFAKLKKYFFAGKIS